MRGKSGSGDPGTHHHRAGLVSFTDALDPTTPSGLRCDSGNQVEAKAPAREAPRASAHVRKLQTTRTVTLWCSRFTVHGIDAS
jgi:hypothetical protein